MDIYRNIIFVRNGQIILDRCSLVFFLFPLFLRLSTLWIMGWQYTLDYGSLASVCYICMNMLDGLANTAAHVKNRTDRRLCMCVTSITE